MTTTSERQGGNINAVICQDGALLLQGYRLSSLNEIKECTYQMGGANEADFSFWSAGGSLIDARAGETL